MQEVATGRAKDSLTPELLGRLRRFVRRRVSTGHDADDLVQDVLVKLVEKGGAVPEGSVGPWLFAVARREIVDRWRKPRLRAGDALEDIPARDGGNDSEEAIAHLSRCMEPMLASLPPSDRALLRRIEIGGESQATVGREAHVRPSTLKSRVQRARRRLRSALEDCCDVEQDRRGNPVGYRSRAGRVCPCD